MITDDPTRQQAALERATELALSYLESLDAAPVATTASLAELRRRFSRPLSDAGVDPVTVIDDLARDSAGGLLGSAGGRFYGWVIGAGLPAALAADWLTSAWDQNAGLYACGPAAAVVEEVCGTWLKDVLGLPASASFALVTGCQMAHVTCLAAARHAVFARAGWDVNRDGLAGAPPVRVLTSSEVHGTTTRAVKLLGIGTSNMVVLPSDPSSRLAPGVLSEALSHEAGRPTIVVLQAGDVNCGAFDPFPELIPLAHDARAWVHIDGAMGLWCNAAPELRHLLAGAEAADSWATDGHKWLNVPYDSGYAFVAHPEHHRAGMEHRASYLIHADDARDPLDWTPEHSRRAWLCHLGGSAGARTHRPGRSRRPLLSPRARHCDPNRRAARRPRHVRPANQPGAPALPRRSARCHRRGPRPPNRRGHGGHQCHRRGLLYGHHVARHALHARLGIQLAHDGQRHRPRRGGGGAGPRAG
jgi:glutamate/tyrosine decarboxylase-like PLP-dependent enzyme